MKGNTSNIFQILIFLVVIGGGVFLFQNFIQDNNSDTEMLSTETDTYNDLEETTTNTTETSKTTKIQPVPTAAVENDDVQARQVAVSDLQTLLSDWESTYLAECNGKEETNECVIWKSGIEEIEATCFLDRLPAAEVTRCGKNVLDSSFRTAFWSKAAEEYLATTTKTTIDQYGIDLVKLPEGKTVKVFENRPTEEVSYGNTTTVTYTREGNLVTIKTVIVYEGERGTMDYTRTVPLE